MGPGLDSPTGDRYENGFLSDRLKFASETSVNFVSFSCHYQ